MLAIFTINISFIALIPSPSAEENKDCNDGDKIFGGHLALLGEIEKRLVAVTKPGCAEIWSDSVFGVRTFVRFRTNLWKVFTVFEFTFGRIWRVFNRPQSQSHHITEKRLIAGRRRQEFIGVVTVRSCQPASRVSFRISTL